MSRQPVQLRRQLDRGLTLQLGESFRRICEPQIAALPRAGALLVDPGALLFGEQLGMTLRTAARNGDPDTSVGSNADNITTGARMADDFHVRITIVRRHGI